MARRQRNGKQPPSNSQFGKVQPTTPFSRRGFFFVFGAAFTAPFFFFSCAYIVQRVAEKTPPSVVILSAPKSLADEGGEIIFEASDEDAGLRAVGVILRQGSRNQQLFVKSYQGEKSTKEIVPIKLANIFQEGKIDILVTASDQSLWKTAVTRSAQLVLDRTDPKLSVVASSSVAKQGEAGIVLYKLFEANLLSTGITVGDQEFPAWPVASISTSEAKISDLFLGLYAVPENSDDSSVEVTLVAKDLAGRESRQSIQKGVKPISNDRQSWDLAEPDLQRTISEAFNGGEPHLLKTSEAEVRQVQAGLMPEDELLATKARLVATVLRPYDMAQLSGLTNSTLLPEPRKWKGAFSRSPGSFKNTFASIITLEKNGAGVATFDTGGRIYEQPPSSTSVFSLAPGRVTFAGTLGSFGNTVIIDHGLGVSTVYAGLGTAIAAPGTDVKRRDRLGITGRSGLLKTQNGFLLMAFVRGIPVDVEQFLRSERASDSLENVLRSLRDGAEK